MSVNKLVVVGGVAGGAMVAGNVITNDIKTAINGSTVTSGADVLLTSESKSIIRTLAVGVAASGGGAGQFSGMGNVIANTVDAEISGGSAVTAGGDVHLSASDEAPR